MWYVRTGWGIVLVPLALVLFPRAALAHDGQPPAPHDLWRAWSFELPVLASLVLAGWGYARGVARLWGRAGIGHGVRVYQVWAFAAGMSALVIALISPLDALSSALFSAHMAQHVVLMLFAAPLLVLGNPGLALLWAFKRHQVNRWLAGFYVTAARVAVLPVAWLLYVAVLWVWHLPGLYQAALTSELLHVFEHACFLGTALLFWWVVLGPGRARERAGAGVFALFALAMQGTLLGALITFASTPWYPSYATSTGAWGLAPLEDQQLAGVIMWLPGGVVYVLAAVGLFLSWFKKLEQRTRHSAPQRQLLPSVESEQR